MVPQYLTSKVRLRSRSEPQSDALIRKDRNLSVKQSYTAKMKQKIDTPEGRQQYSRRLGIVEPVFGQLGLKRFSLRGWVKVNIQWKLFCIVHNLTKIYRYGYS